VRVTVERQVVSVGRPAEVVEAAVRGELGHRRVPAEIQTFVNRVAIPGRAARSAKIGDWLGTLRVACRIPTATRSS
jgi:hypothetical protein